MAEKRINGRIVNKHDTEAVWSQEIHKDFIPMQGEFIVYDIDASHAFERVKIGDGKKSVVDLPFVNTDVQISSSQPTFACLWFKVKQ